jgi:AcrR family transcriptional regulator
MKTRPRKREETSDRIIAAAGAVFAEHGFRDTTIRQITARAGVNLASVNYHFRDKNELYIRVLREAKRFTTDIVIPDLTGRPEERLRAFINRFVGNLLNPKRPAWHCRVLALEMSNPTPALGVVIREVTAPLYRDVQALIREVVGPTASAAELDLFTLSIFGQCIFYVCGRPVVEQLAIGLGRGTDRNDRIADHIAVFSIAALHKLRRRAEAKPRSQASRGRSKELVLR